MEIEARLGDEIILRGSVRNVSGHDWPSALSRDCFLQVGAELQISGSLAAAARQKIMGDCFADGQTIDLSYVVDLACGDWELYDRSALPATILVRQPWCES